MSGIVGIASDDPNILSRPLVAELTASLRFRGPDGDGSWLAPGVGFGHAALTTSADPAGEDGLAILGDDLAVVADARIDGRDDLIAALRDRGLDGRHATDARLILLAYRAWGEGLVERLIGDFAFAIWDRQARRLVCARDHVGVKPFYYAEPDRSLIFSNTLECLRRHPSVPNTLDEVAIADYLLFKYSEQPAATAFREIRRLPPGHLLSWSSGGPARVSCYWKLSESAPIRYREPRQYVEHFNEIFEAAVRDRIRSARVAVSMSGGLDSSAIAAAAARLTAGGAQSQPVVAHTMVFKRLIPDDERHFAQQVADGLGIPIQFFEADEYSPFSPPEEEIEELPEFGDSTYRRLELDFAARLASTSRVVLSGMDADSFLAERTLEHFDALVRRRQLGELARAMGRFAIAFRRRPPMGIGRLARRWRDGAPVAPPLPAWIDRVFADRLGLPERMQAVHERRQRRDSSLRPRAMRASITTLWTTVFGRGDAESTRQPLEFRYPFADVRLARFLLAVPVVPWCTDKALLREALKGVIPESVRVRRKSPLAIDPLRPSLRDAKSPWIDGFVPAAALGRYVDRRKVPQITGRTGDDVYVNLRPLCLNRWLERRYHRPPGGKSDVTEARDVRKAVEVGR